MATSMQPDFSIFDNIHSVLESRFCSYKPSNCTSIKRLLIALAYYDQLDINSNTNDQLTFCNFMETLYGYHIYDDMYHFTKFHQNQTELFHQIPRHCNLSNCAYSNRHFRIGHRSESKSAADTQYLDVYIEVMDSFHFYIFHISQSMLRDDRKRSEIQLNDIEMKDNDEYYDVSFSRLNVQIRNSRQATERFPRLNTNKFNISVPDHSSMLGSKESEISDDIIENDETFLDYLYEHLSSVDMELIQALQDIITVEEYCTESLDIDVDIFIQHGVCNLSSPIENIQFLHEIVKIFEASKSDSGSFSIGIPWKYWKGKGGFDEDNDPYRVCPRFNDFKEEMLNYKYLNIAQYKHRVYNKAKQYIKTNTAQSLRAQLFEDSVYGRIKHGDSLNMNNLIALILYCDYTELSSDFTRSFRKLHQFELLSHIKARNAKYYHFSMILKETIKCYGQTGGLFGHNGFLSELQCPLYCGMSVVLNITQFNILLLSPTSTSVHVEVALKFSGERGMILEFENKRGRGKNLRGMDCSWISRYREEDER